MIMKWKSGDLMTKKDEVLKFLEDNSLEAVFVSGVQCLRKRLPDFNTTKDILSHSTRSVNLFLRSARSG